MAMHYSDPARAHDPYSLPNLETFEIIDRHPEDNGWYWWSCFPGCLPDTDEPIGPFATEADALRDALGCAAGA